MDLTTLIFMVLMKITFFMTALILAPIDALILEFLPDVTASLDNIANLFGLIATSIGWAISASGIQAGTIALVGIYLMARINVPISTYFLKLALGWYKAIKG